MALTLVIGNKKYSSWSLRPWIAMRQAGIAFDEILVPLYESGSPEKIRQYNPAGKVPVLLDGGAIVWETIAILEHLAEKFPEVRLWPADPEARALARSVAAEMHGGFAALRGFCPMNLGRPPRKRATPQPADVTRDVARIDAIWNDCRARFGRGGPFLFGAFGAADAMYAPVVARVHHYGLDVSGESQNFVDAVRALAAYRDWERAGLAESWTLANSDVD